jgi:hypothetical protein
MSSAAAPQMAFNSLFGVLGIALAIGFLIVAFIVKSTRPDVFGLMMGSSVTGVVNAFFGLVWMMAMPNIIARGGHSAMDMASMSAVIGLFRTILNVTSGVLLMIAIAKLAKPPAQEQSSAFAQGRYQ